MEFRDLNEFLNARRGHGARDEFVELRKRFVAYCEQYESPDDLPSNPVIAEALGVGQATVWAWRKKALRDQRTKYETLERLIIALERDEDALKIVSKRTLTRYAKRLKELRPALYKKLGRYGIGRRNVRRDEIFRWARENECDATSITSRFKCGHAMAREALVAAGRSQYEDAYEPSSIEPWDDYYAKMCNGFGMELEPEVWLRYRALWERKFNGD